MSVTRRGLLAGAALTAAGAMLCETVAAEPDTFYVSPTGTDAGDGSRNRPWRSLHKAVGSIRPGSTVVLRHGIYRGSAFAFGPAGADTARRTVFRTMRGERPLFTTDDGLPPEVRIADYVRVEGLWFGGRWETGSHGAVHPGGSPISRGIEIVGCTIFGYRGDGIGIGSAQDLLIQGNRFVRCGNSRFEHGIYLSGGYTPGSMTQHVVVDNNLMVRGEGYAIHGWHNPHSCIVTRNFITGYFWSLVLSGSDHLVAHNVLWRASGQQGHEPGWNVWLPCERVVFANNVCGAPIGIYDSASSAVIDQNAYIASAPFPKDTAPASVRSKEAVATWSFGLDAASERIDRAFAGPIEVLHADTRLERDFASLREPPPSASGLRRAGRDLGVTDERAPDVGITVHTSPERLWRAFDALHLRHFNNRGAPVASIEDALAYRR